MCNYLDEKISKLINLKNMEKKVKILITSVGSLVGQNIQDVLEFPEFRRRELVELIGTNSIASSPNNFRCDKCYLVSNTNTIDFINEIKYILKKEQPDLILSGRDEDSETLALLLHENDELPGRTPYGKPITLKYALDKGETSLFCKKHNLPFAETFCLGKSGGLDELAVFAEKYKYPLIAKPIQGFASKGVFFVRKWKEVLEISNLQNYLFQEYLGDATKLEKYFTQMDGLTPLFAHAPNIFHHSCHTVIAPDGTFDEIFISRNEHDSGVTVGFKRVFDPELEELTSQFARAIYKEGGYGPFTVQFREDKNKKWKVQEMNMRTNGNTFPRFMMGQDDLGLIFQGVLPEVKFPVYKAESNTHKNIIGKVLTSYVMHPDEIEILKENKEWILEHNLI
jgi:hypothetical protein